MRSGITRPAAFALDSARLPTGAGSLSALALPLVDPDRNQFGREAEGLALARLALEQAVDDENAARAGFVLT